MPADISLTQAAPGGALSERLLRAIAGRLGHGRLRVRLPDGTERIFEGERAGPEAELIVRRKRLFRRVLSGGALGFAEAYVDGDCESPDLTALIMLAARNETALRRALEGRAWARASRRLIHRLRPNSRRGSRRNIAAHYDLGNEFYALWLDPAVTYSAGLFEGGHEDLTTAQEAKYRRMAETAGIEAHHHVLELGCGWGGFALWAAREIGCRVTAITISRAQHEFARGRVRAAGLADRVDVRLQDYRDLDGRFDRIVSIEMFEAIGEAYWATFLQVLRDRLAPGGRAALQVITIANSAFEAYRRDADFIQRHIFPGGMLPSPAALHRAVAQAGLSWREARAHGDDYARTLALWRRRFEAAWPAIERLGFDARFRRLWRYYLAYCEAGFRVGRIDVLQVGLARDPAPSP